MCFSAEASFGSAVVLVPAGIYCLRRAIPMNPSFIPLATVPIVFGVQQFCEGLVWVGLDQGRAVLVGAASWCFLFFSLAFWPFWIPFGAMCIEPRRGRKLLLGGVALVGMTGGLALYLPLVVNHDLVSTRVGHHSIQYDLARLPAFRMTYSIPYGSKKWCARFSGLPSIREPSGSTVSERITPFGFQ